MLPIILAPQYLKTLVIGKGPATTRRLEMIAAARVQNVRYIESFPVESDFENINIVYVADFDDEVSEKIFHMAEARKLLINTEDKIQFCNFHAPAIVRRGDLLLTVSTAGKGPRLARRIKRILENLFGAEWKENLEHLSNARCELKKQGFKFDSMAEKIDKEIEEKQMFSSIPEKYLK